VSGSAPVHLVTGDDARLVADAVLGLVAELVGDEDRDLVVDEWAGEEYTLFQVAESARTPPFLTEKRAVVARGVERFGVDDLQPVIDYLAEPLPTTALVLEWTGGRVPKKLTDAVARAGGSRLSVGAPSQARARSDWVETQVAAADLALTAPARRLLAERLGEDTGRLPAVLATLAGAYGPAARLDVEDVEPFVGDAGGVPPWELTDPIDRGDIGAALRALARMVEGGERHPLVVMASLHGHFERMLRVEGPEPPDESTAAQLLGDRSTFRTSKTLAQARRLGPDGVRAAYQLMAAADVDLRGRSGLDARTTLEILVARLAQLAKAGSGQARSATARSVRR
jgi:DNA polymerase III subunit delta